MVKALRLRGYTGTVIGIDSDFETRKLAASSGLFEQVLENGEAVLSSVDLLILAVPLGRVREALKSASGMIGPKTLVTDAGSVKTTVHHMAESVLDANTTFIGGHPMAGSDRSGFSSASPILFENAYYFLTLGANACESELLKLQALVKKLGAIPVVTTASEHDALAAKLSHLPHLTACALVNTFVQNLPVEALKYAGGGFRDTTRIAMGDPKLWRDIFTQNKQQLFVGIDGLIEELLKFKAMLSEEKSEEMVSHLNKTQKIRNGLTARRPREEASLYPLVLDVEDKPGILASVTGILAKNHLNIKDIALDHARESLPGALILSFASNAERAIAVQLVTDAKLCKIFIEQD